MAKKRRPKADSADAAPTVQPSKTEGSTAPLWQHAVFAISLSLAGILIGTFVIWWQVIIGGNRGFNERLTNDRVAGYVALFNGRLEALQAQVHTLASDPGTLEALMTFDEAAIQAHANRLQALIPDARRIEIVESGKAKLDLDSAVPISFQALAVIRTSEEQAYVGPEMSTTDRGVFYVAEPITRAGRVAGSLFIVFDSAYFYRPLAQFDLNAGTLALHQQFEGTPPTAVMEYGSGGNPNDEGVKAQLSARHWFIVFKPSEATSVLSILTLAAPTGLAIALMLAGIALAFSRLFRRLESDAALFADFLSRLARGRGGALDRYNLGLFQRLAAGASMGRKTAFLPEEKDDDLDFETFTFEDDEDDGDDDDEQEAARAPAPEKKKPSKPKARTSARPDDNFGIEVSEEDASPLDLGAEIDAEIFRAYDIRGIVEKNLTPDTVYWIGRAFAAEALDRGQEQTVVGGDGRHSTDDLRKALINGLSEGGLNTIDIGMVPTPVLYFATHSLNTNTGIMITGSHNPPAYNGLKMVIGGETLAEGAIQKLRLRIENNELSEGDADRDEVDVIDDYIERIVEDVAIAQAMKVVVDCGNGVAGLVAPRLLRDLGCEVVELYTKVDGSFPNHHPDPADPANLVDLMTVVADEGADIGLAFDGDGDRLGVVTNAGTIVWPDKLMMLFSRDVVGRNPGADIIYDVKCSRHLNTIISELGGRPIMWKTGHSHIKAKIKETGALLGGEFSGHICFAERWYGFDDAIYSAARLLEILSTEGRSVEDVFAEFPATVSTPEIKIPTTETAKFEILDALAKNGDFGDGTLTTIDGIRVDYEDGWGLVRASNTSPVLTLRFEADAQAALDRIQEIFERQLAAIDSSLKFRT